MKNKICIIFTGGTISCKINNKVLSPTPDKASELINLYYDVYGKNVSFDCLYPINILSENITENALNTLYNTVSKVDDNNYDGIIITHGTDTLSFTANLFAFTLNKKIPVLFVSSLFPLSDKKSNGLCNFYNAVNFIKQEKKGVFVSFKNNNENCKIHLASKTQEIDYNGNLYSFIDKEFATNLNDKFIYNYSLNKNKTLNYKLDSNVFLINSHSLCDFSLFKLSYNVKAVILKTYHSGTFCSYGETTNALSFAKQLKEKNIPLIISPVVKTDCVYESFCKGDNVIISYNQSLEACITKTMLALGNGLDIEKVLNDEYNNEFIKLKS